MIGKDKLGCVGDVTDVLREMPEEMERSVGDTVPANGR
jgi:hypothetical protein